MNPIQLRFPDGTTADCWQCSECKLFYSGDGWAAGRCCVCQRCGKSSYQGPSHARATVCEECWGPYHAEIDRKRLDKATEIENYDGPVVIDGDRYFEDLDALVEYLSGEDREWPEFAHTCHVNHYQIDADNVYEMVLGDAPEGHDVDILEGVDAFNAAIEAFNAANRSNDAATYWEPDYKHKVRVPAPAKE